MLQAVGSQPHAPTEQEEGAIVSPRTGQETKTPTIAEQSLDPPKESFDRTDERVTGLLEQMNTASMKLNQYTSALASAHRRHERLLQQWQDSHRSMLALHGPAIGNKIQPYFEAEEARQRVAVQLQRSLEGFGRATAELHKEGQDLMHVVATQHERDWHERMHVQALQDYQSAMANRQRAEVGVRTEQIARHSRSMARRIRSSYTQLLSSSEYEIRQMEAAANCARLGYNAALRSLERINDSIHNRRCKLSRLRCNSSTIASVEHEPTHKLQHGHGRNLSSDSDMSMASTVDSEVCTAYGSWD